MSLTSDNLAQYFHKRLSVSVRRLKCISYCVALGRNDSAGQVKHQQLVICL